MCLCKQYGNVIWDLTHVGLSVARRACAQTYSVQIDTMHCQHLLNCDGRNVHAALAALQDLKMLCLLLNVIG